jgi:hypothetical protein
VSTDGDLALCRRVNDGTAKVRQYKDGGEYYCYRLHGAATPAPLPEPTAAPETEAKRADPDTLHRVYSALLDQLPLQEHHVNDLRERGLEGNLRDAGYRSWPLGGRAQAARLLIDLGLEQHLPFVPGFRLKEGDNGRAYWTLFGAPGLVVPVRDAAGRVRALLIRPDKQVPGKKYVYLSSRRDDYNGPGPGSPIHVPRFDGDRSTVRVTEGALKADVATALSGTLTIGLPGVSAISRAGKVLRYLGASTVRLAFDADARNKPAVAGALKRVAEELRGEGLVVELEVWDLADGKGIDDVLHNVKTPRVFSGADVVTEIENIARSAGTARTMTTEMTSGPVQNLPRRLANFEEQVVNDKTVRVGLSATAIADRLLRMTDNWPKRVRERLFVAKDHQPLWLDTPDALLAWWSRFAGSPGGNSVCWRTGADMVSRGEFLALLQQQADCFAAVEERPHHPPFPHVYYLHAPLPPATGTAFSQLLDYFRPSSETDRELIRALFLTLVWGGPAGQRPAFLIESEPDDPEKGRGVGKSKLAQAAGRLLGGHVEISHSENVEQVKTRLLSPSALRLRVCLVDNIKTLRLSNADLEALVTTNVISGKQMYVGEAQRPNLLTWVLTLNGASLSRDMAQRCIPVRLKRPAHDPSWEAAVWQFIDANRQAILSDLIAELKRPVPPLKHFSRWSSWEASVLSRCANPEAAQQLIAQRQGEIDDDSAEAEVVREEFVSELRRRGHDPEAEGVRLPSKAVAEVVNQAKNDKMAPNKASAYLRTLAIPELHKSDRSGDRGWAWKGARYDPGTPLSELHERYNPSRSPFA